MFVDAHVIPDGTDPNDAKVYFFFKEKLADNSRSTKQIHSMTARICPVSVKVVLIWRKSKKFTFYKHIFFFQKFIFLLFIIYYYQLIKY